MSRRRSLIWAALRLRLRCGEGRADGVRVLAGRGVPAFGALLFRRVCRGLPGRPCAAAVRALVPGPADHRYQCTKR